jgi:hypothetical protein
VSDDYNSEFSTSLSDAIAEDVSRLKGHFRLYHIDLVNLYSSSNGICAHFGQLDAANLAFLK